MKRAISGKGGHSGVGGEQIYSHFGGISRFFEKNVFLRPIPLKRARRVHTSGEVVKRAIFGRGRRSAVGGEREIWLSVESPLAGPAKIATRGTSRYARFMRFRPRLLIRKLF